MLLTARGSRAFFTVALVYVHMRTHIYHYICALILLHVCPHTTTYVSLYYCICVLILLHMFPHTTTCVSSYYCICVLILLYVSLYHYICALVLLHVCPHTTTYAFLTVAMKHILPPHLGEYEDTHTPLHVSSYYYICFLNLWHETHSRNHI